jgi:hypothetical protein
MSLMTRRGTGPTSTLERALILLAAAGALLLVFAGLAARAAPAPPRVSTLWSQDEPLSGLAWDGSSLWVTLDGSPVIRAVDPRTGAVRRSLPFATPDTGGSAWDGRWLWQIAYLDRTIHKIDLRTGVVVGRIPTPGEGLCSGMTFDGRLLWVANFDDRRIYAIDPEDEGRTVTAIDGHFETTGLAWDGRHLWSGLLVGTVTHDEPTPYTGFVQQMRLDTGATLRVLSVPGVGPGTSDWLPGRPEARRFWWYDGFNRRVVGVELAEPAALALALPSGTLLLLAVLALGTAPALAARRRAPARVPGGLATVRDGS